MSNRAFKILILFATLLLGLTVFLLIGWVDRSFSFLPEVQAKRETISPVVASFAFTTFGFLATIITILFGLSDRAYFIHYEREGLLSHLLFFYLTIILTLFGTFILSLLTVTHPECARLLLTFAAVNICQLILISFIGFNLVKGSNDSPRRP